MWISSDCCKEEEEEEVVADDGVIEEERVDDDAEMGVRDSGAAASAMAMGLMCCIAPETTSASANISGKSSLLSTEKSK